MVHAGRIRVAALCIGVEGYTHLPEVACAARDAHALDVRINATPFGSSAFIRHPKATSTSNMLLRAIRMRLHELAERYSPPDFFLLYYGGHVVHLASKFDPALLQETKSFLVPASANPKCSDDCAKSCLPVTKVLNVLRKDLCEPVASRGKKVVVLAVLDTHRRVLQGGTGLAFDDFASSIIPENTALVVLHQRKVANHDRLHSPFIKACLDPQNGMLADNISVVQVLTNLCCQGEDAAIVGLNNISETFCCVHPDAPPDLEIELRTLLQNWKLEGQANILIRHGILRIADLEAMQLEDVELCGLNVRFRTLLEHVQQVSFYTTRTIPSGRQKVPGDF